MSERITSGTDIDDIVNNMVKESRNPQPRTPIVVCVDTSFSMQTFDRNSGMSRLELVCEGLRSFCRELSADSIARSSIELCLITYGGGGVKVAQDFAYVNDFKVPKLTAGGGTPLVDAVEEACRVLEKKLVHYQDVGGSNHLPLILVIGDGGMSDDERRVSRAAELVRRRVAARRLAIRGAIVGSPAEVREDKLLNTLTGGETLPLDVLDITHFFNWLSKAALRTSKSIDQDERLYMYSDWRKYLEIYGGK